MTSPRHHPRRRLRLAAAVVITAGLTLTGTLAQAHVSARADSTASGSFSAVTFRVPNESDSASTTRLSVELPQDTPLLYVSSKPVPGWKVVATEAPLGKPVESYGTTITKAVRTVTWTAEAGSGIAPGQYQEFSLSVGPLPAAGPLLLPAEQTYSDGEVVRWNEPTPAGGAEPEHPAPVITVTAAVADGGATPVPTEPATTAVPTQAAAGSDGIARGLAGGALVVALAALAVAVLGRRRQASAAP